MNQNTTVDNDLQKAIDDITKSAGSDPLFADPVAAPVGPFPNASATPAMPPNPPMPPNMSMPIPEEVAPAEPVSAPAEDIKPTPIVHEDEPELKAPAATENNLGISKIKEAALRELAPIADKLNIPAEQKFSIYKDIIDNYHDSSIIEPAYRAASDITDDQTRAEALLYIIDSIDHM